jgi:hypothetical protein
MGAMVKGFEGNDVGSKYHVALYEVLVTEAPQPVKTERLVIPERIETI